MSSAAPLVVIQHTRRAICTSNLSPRTKKKKRFCGRKKRRVARAWYTHFRKFATDTLIRRKDEKRGETRGGREKRSTVFGVRTLRRNPPLVYPLVVLYNTFAFASISRSMKERNIQKCEKNEERKKEERGESGGE